MSGETIQEAALETYLTGQETAYKKATPAEREAAITSGKFSGVLGKMPAVRSATVDRLRKRGGAYKKLPGDVIWTSQSGKLRFISEQAQADYYGSRKSRQTRGRTPVTLTRRAGYTGPTIGSGFGGRWGPSDVMGGATVPPSQILDVMGGATVPPSPGGGGGGWRPQAPKEDAEGGAGIGAVVVLTGAAYLAWRLLK